MPIISQLIRKGNQTGSVACWKTHKSVSYQTATEWEDENVDKRIKSKRIERWFEWSPTRLGRKITNKRHTIVLMLNPADIRARTNYSTAAISRKGQVLSDNLQCLSL